MEIFIILGLIVLNGVLSMSEIALVSARKSKLETDAKKGSKSAKATILVYPRKVGTNEYIQLICRPQNGKSETTKMSIRLVKK